jgi:hypothetical protein
MDRMDHNHWIPAGEWPQLIQRVCAAQADMEEPARLRFDEENSDHLKVLIRLTIEFHYYLQSKRSGAPDQENLTLNYVCDSILGGVESFRWVTVRYQGLIGAVDSRVKWGVISVALLKEQFISMFQEFAAETNFEKKCRLLLDLFKLQIVFAGFSHD